MKNRVELMAHALAVAAGAPDNDAQAEVQALLPLARRIVALIEAAPPEPRPLPENTREFLREMAVTLKAKLPDNYGFILLAAPSGEKGRLVYTSTFERTGAINVLKEWLLKCGAHEDWMTHIK